MMPKAFWIFIQIVIFKIVLSTQWIAIEMEDLKSTSRQNVDLANLNVNKIQSKLQLKIF